MKPEDISIDNLDLLHMSPKQLRQELKKLAKEIQVLDAQILDAKTELGGRMDRNEFYELAMKPEFGDEMAYQLERTTEGDDAERTFSEEGIDGIAKQVKDFMMARTYAQYVETGKGPKQVRVEIKLVWGTLPEEDAIQPIPWFHLHDEKNPFLQAEGLHRLPLDKIEDS